MKEAGWICYGYILQNRQKYYKLFTMSHEAHHGETPVIETAFWRDFKCLFGFLAIVTTLENAGSPSKIGASGGGGHH